MSKARDIANILSANTAIATDAELTSAVSAHSSATDPHGDRANTTAQISTHSTALNGHVGRGITENRPASPTVGDLYFDTTLNALIAYRVTGWEKVSQDPAPQIASISPVVAATTGSVITITGSNFKSGLSVQFIGTNAVSYNSPVATFVGAGTATASTPSLPVAYEPYDVKVINSDNQFAVLDNCLDVGGTPTWNTASGTIATISEQTSLNVSVSATDPDGTSIVYSSTNLPLWISLNSSTGALTGTSPDIASNTTYTFDIIASDGVNSSSRSFSVVSNSILKFGSSSWISGVNYSGSANINISSHGDISNNLVYSIQGGAGNGISPSNYPAFWTQNASGSYILKKYISDASGASINNALIDSSGNSYISYGTKITKVDVSGNVLWTRSVNYTYLNIFGLDSTETKILGTVSNYEDDKPFAINTSDGSLVWTKSASGGGLGVINGYTGGVGGSVLVISGYERNGTNYAFCRSVNISDGSQNFSVRHSNGGFVGTIGFADSNNNAYFGGYTSSGCFMTKLNSTGSLQWSKIVGSSQQYPKFGAVDSSGNVYWGHNDGSKHYILKFDSSGNLLWQRSFAGSAGTSNSGAIEIVDNNYISCTFSASDGSYVSGYTAIVPTDGSKTGTYSVNGKSIVYAVSSLSVGNSGASITGSAAGYGSGSVTSTSTTNATLGNIGNSVGQVSI